MEREERAALHRDRVLPRAGGVLPPVRRRCALPRRVEGVVHDADVDVALFATVSESQPQPTGAACEQRVALTKSFGKSLVLSPVSQRP